MTQQSDRAWKYYNGADMLLIARVQALLVAQSFLVIAYAMLTANITEKEWPHFALMLLICGMGTCLAFLVMWKNRKLADGIAALRRLLIKDRVYKIYDNALNEETLTSKRVFTTVIPVILIIFWISLIMLTVTQLVIRI